MLILFPRRPLCSNQSFCFAHIPFLFQARDDFISWSVPRLLFSSTEMFCGFLYLIWLKIVCSVYDVANFCQSLLLDSAFRACEIARVLFILSCYSMSTYTLLWLNNTSEEMKQAKQYKHMYLSMSGLCGSLFLHAFSSGF